MFLTLSGCLLSFDHSMSRLEEVIIKKERKFNVKCVRTWYNVRIGNTTVWQWLPFGDA